MAESDTIPVTLAKGSKLQITKNGIKPCSQCYRARQFVKDSIGRLRRRPATHTRVQTNLGGAFLIDNTTHTLVAVCHEAYNHWLGCRVILDAGYVVDVATTERITQFTRYQKITIPESRA